MASSWFFSSVTTIMHGAINVRLPLFESITYDVLRSNQLPSDCLPVRFRLSGRVRWYYVAWYYPHLTVPFDG